MSVFEKRFLMPETELLNRLKNENYRDWRLVRHGWLEALKWIVELKTKNLLVGGDGNISSEIRREMKELENGHHI